MPENAMFALKNDSGFESPRADDKDPHRFDANLLNLGPENH